MLPLSYSASWSFLFSTSEAKDGLKKNLGTSGVSLEDLNLDTELYQQTKEVRVLSEKILEEMEKLGEFFPDYSVSDHIDQQSPIPKYLLNTYQYLLNILINEFEDVAQSIKGEYLTMFYDGLVTLNTLGGDLPHKRIVMKYLNHANNALIDVLEWELSTMDF